MKHIDKIILAGIFIVVLAAVLYFYFIALNKTISKPVPVEVKIETEQSLDILQMLDFSIKNAKELRTFSGICDRTKNPELLTCTMTIDYVVKEVK